jgi:hypothetical protein
MNNRSAAPFIAMENGSAEAIRFFRRRAHVSPESRACAPHPIDLPWYLPEVDFSV